MIRPCIGKSIWPRAPNIGYKKALLVLHIWLTRPSQSPSGLKNIELKHLEQHMADVSLAIPSYRRPELLKRKTLALLKQQPGTGSLCLGPRWPFGAVRRLRIDMKMAIDNGKRLEVRRSWRLRQEFPLQQVYVFVASPEAHLHL